MSYQAPDFKTALTMDMMLKGLNERTLGQKIGVTQQAISKWVKRGFPPAYRWDQLKAVFGPDSHLARLTFERIATEANASRLRAEAPSNVPAVPEVAQIARVANTQRSLADIYGAEAAWMRVVKLLPPGVQEAAGRTNLPAGRFPATVDFFQFPVAVEFVVSHKAGVPTNLSQPLLKLAAIKKANPEVRTALCLLAPNGADNARTRLGYGELLGVETWVCATEEEAAIAIAAAVRDGGEGADTED